MSDSDGTYDPPSPAAHHDLPAPTAAAESSTTARFRSFPKTSFAAVEYPSTVSHPSALLRVIDQEDINRCFNTPIAEPTMLEMKFGGSERNGVPIRGARVASQKLLLKMTRRRRKRRVRADGEPVESRESHEGSEEGVFTSEVVGPISQTVRFRYMADYSYTPDPNGRTSQLLSALKELDYDAILEYSVPPLNEDFMDAFTPPIDADTVEPELRSNLDLQPLPIFDHRILPLIYNYKNHASSVTEEIEDPHTGEFRKRVVNASSYKAKAMMVVAYDAPTDKVPTGPAKGALDPKKKLDKRLLARLNALMQERPVWLRRALLAQFSPAERDHIEKSKNYLPCIAYTFGAGPYWKCMSKFDYDPRMDPEAALYHRIYFYLGVNRQHRVADMLESSSEDEADKQDHNMTWEERQEELVEAGKRPPVDASRGYIFDGQVLHQDSADYQLCDITDPDIRTYIDDPGNRSEEYHPKHGWFKPAAIDLIKALTRAKYEYIRKHGEAPPQSLCSDLVEAYERAKSELLDAGAAGDMADEDAGM